jgi:hypothetical protein
MPNTKPIGVAFKDPQLDGAVIGESAANGGKAGFYGKTPVVQRPYSAAVHATSAQATSSAFGATQLATLNELINTMVGLGIYATV